MIRFILISTLFISAADSKPTGSAPVANADMDWRSLNRCGPNSLYVLLRMSGRSVVYDTLLEKMRLTDRGASVADIVRTAREYGLGLTPLKAPASALDTLPLPAIAHLNIPGEDRGHYLLVLAQKKNGDIAVIECTEGNITIMPRGTFLDRWSGVILVRSGQLQDTRIDYALIGGSAAIFVLLPAFLWSYRNRRQVSSDVSPS